MSIEMDKKVGEALGVKYPEFYDVGPSLNPSILLMFGTGLRSSIGEIYEADSKLTYQLRFMANKPDIIHVIGMQEVKGETEYEDHGMWDAIEWIHFDQQEATSSWIVRGSQGSAVLKQNQISQILPPNSAHNYFRMIISN